MVGRLSSVVFTKKYPCRFKNPDSVVELRKKADFLSVLSFMLVDSKGPVIRATFPCNLSRNIITLQVAKLCCPYYHPRKQLVAQKILALHVVATCCTK